MSNQSTPFVSSAGESRNPFYEGQFDDETPEQAVARLHWARVATETAALKAGQGEAIEPVVHVQVTGSLDEIDAPVWPFINAEAQKVGAEHGRIETYKYERANGGVAVLWDANRIHALAVTIRDDMNRTRCIRMLAVAPAAPVAPDPILVEAVAVTKENEDGELYLDWILEGGIAALELPGTTLLVAHGQITDDTGSGEIYTAPPTTDGVSVPLELAARLCHTDNHIRQTARRELRNTLLALQVKP